MVKVYVFRSSYGRLRQMTDETSYRKLQVTGGSTFIVSLPKEWVRTNKLAQGDPVGIETMQSGQIQISPTTLKKSLVSELPPSVRLASFCSRKSCFLLFFLSKVPSVSDVFPISYPKAKPIEAAFEWVAAVELLYPLVTVTVLPEIPVTSICSVPIDITS